MRLLLAVVAGIGLLFAVAVTAVGQNDEPEPPYVDDPYDTECWGPPGCNPVDIYVEPRRASLDSTIEVDIGLCSDGSWWVTKATSNDVLVSQEISNGPPYRQFAGTFHASELDGPGEYLVKAECRNPETVYNPQDLLVLGPPDSTSSETPQPLEPAPPPPTEPAKPTLPSPPAPARTPTLEPKMTG